LGIYSEIIHGFFVFSVFNFATSRKVVVARLDKKPPSTENDIADDDATAGVELNPNWNDCPNWSDCPNCVPNLISVVAVGDKNAVLSVISALEPARKLLDVEDDIDEEENVKEGGAKLDDIDEEEKVKEGTAKLDDIDDEALGVMLLNERVPLLSSLEYSLPSLLSE